MIANQRIRLLIQEAFPLPNQIYQSHPAGGEFILRERNMPRDLPGSIIGRYPVDYEILVPIRSVGRPQSEKRHAAIFLEFLYLQWYEGLGKIEARIKLMRKYGHSEERAVRRITNASEWDESFWSLAIGSDHFQQTFVVLFDKREKGWIRGIDNQLLAAEGTGWTWHPNLKSAIWGNIQLKSPEPVPSDLLTDDKYLLEAFP